MDHAKKLLDLLGTTSLRDHAEPTTYEELLEIGGYYGDLFEKAFAKGEVQTDRVTGETARLLAEMFQGEARKRYGVADTASVRRLAAETFETEADEEMERQMGLLREGIARSGLDLYQQSSFLREMEAFKAAFVDLICDEAARLQLIPLENISEISLALAEMIKEE